MQMAATLSPRTRATPATDALRAGLYTAPDVDSLVALFAAMLSEHGIEGHMCVAAAAGPVVPIFGDTPALLGDAAHTLALSNARLRLGAPAAALDSGDWVRLAAYAELYVAQALQLREQANDVATSCGLSLRERSVLGRRLAGLAPVDIAIEAGLSVTTVADALDAAVARLGGSEAQAIALAARRGWLVVPAVDKNFLGLDNTYIRMA